ncbi:hypothetical protein [Bacteroides heparinolyticus]|uniref:hypothetical protein n=1 Tax=Prevotella heparinolytica TaxID=28113 RepID=UPI003FA156D8
MKKQFYDAMCLLAFLSLALWTTGCSDDDGYSDVDGQSPTMTLATEHIESGAGHSFTIRAALSDADGIATVSLQCADLFLDKTIDLVEIYGAPQEKYDLDYSYRIEKDEIGERFTIKVTVTDIGGRSVSQDVLVTMDGDFAKPTFTVAPDKEVTVLMKSLTMYNLRFTVTDDRVLAYVLINISGIEGFDNRRVDVIGGQSSLVFAEKITLPNEVKDYNVTITAVDAKGNSTTTTSVLKVSEMPDFPKMYLADVATVEELNSDVFGVPMLIAHTAPYRYTAKYYNREAGTEIFFLPQKSDFAPICFGMDPEDSNRLTDDPETAKPIVLEKAEVYYEITFDVKEGNYSVNTYPVAEAGNHLPQAIGSDFYLDKGQPQYVVPFQIGVLGNLPGANGGPGEIIVFTQDKINPNLFYTDTIDLEEGKELNFIIHNKHDWGWWDYCLWRVDNSADPEYFLYGGADASPKPKDVWGKPVVKASGTYRFWFDAHLERGKLVPAN